LTGLREDAHKELNIIKEPVVVEIAAAHNKTPAQVVFNWHLNRGYVLLTKTVTESRLAENIDCYNFKLTDEEYKKIDGLDQGAHFINPKVLDGYNCGNCPIFD